MAVGLLFQTIVANRSAPGTPFFCGIEFFQTQKKRPASLWKKIEYHCNQRCDQRKGLIAGIRFLSAFRNQAGKQGEDHIAFQF